MKPASEIRQGPFVRRSIPRPGALVCAETRNWNMRVIVVSLREHESSLVSCFSRPCDQQHVFLLSLLVMGMCIDVTILLPLPSTPLTPDATPPSSPALTPPLPRSIPSFSWGSNWLPKPWTAQPEECLLRLLVWRVGCPFFLHRPSS